MNPRAFPSRSFLPLALLAAVPTVASAAPGDVLAPTALVSHTSSGQGGNSWSQWAAISHTGRFVAFTSDANDLVVPYVNPSYDVFLHDRQTGAVELISASTNGLPTDGPSIMPSLSGDGRYVCFNSGTTNLVQPPAIGFFSIYVRDRLTGTTELVSVNDQGIQANNTSEFSSISADGRYVAFGSYADNLEPGHPTAGIRDLYRHDRQTSKTILVSRGFGGTWANSSTSENAISGDGRFVAFSSQADNLIQGGTTPGRQHIYVYDSQSGAISLASADANGFEADGVSFKPALSADGRFLAFETSSTNILQPTSAGATIVVLRDLTSGAILDVNKDSLGQPISWPTSQPTLSADARFVSFGSGPVLPAHSGQRYVRDRLLGKTIAVCSMENGTNPIVGAYEAMLSGDGTSVALLSGHALVSSVADGAQVYVRGIGAPIAYCQAKTNSQGCMPAIGFSGQARVSNNFALTVTGSNALNSMVGLLIHGLTGPQQTPFASGFLCVAPPFARSIPTNSGGNAPPLTDCSGVFSFNLGTVLAASPIGPMVGAGSVLTLQWWGRDTGFLPPNAVQLTDALQVVVGP